MDPLRESGLGGKEQEGRCEVVRPLSFDGRDKGERTGKCRGGGGRTANVVNLV